MMSEGEDLQTIGQLNGYYVTGEGTNRHLANRLIVYVGYSPAYLRESFNDAKCPPYFSSEAFGYTCIALAVPTERFVVLELRRLDDP